MRPNRYLLAAALILAAVAGWTTDTVLDQAARDALAAGRPVMLVIEQNGQQMLVPDGGSVVLGRDPFTIWVIHGTGGGVLLQVSAGSRVADAIGFGDALVRNLGDDAGQVMGLAEGVFNDERTLYLDTFAAHYLMNPRTSIDHRYNRLYLGTSENNFTVGGRDVEYLVDLAGQGKTREYSIRHAPFDSVFVTAIVSTLDANYMPYIVDYHRVRLEFLPQ